MLVSDFDFHLPEALIAQHPAPRGTSRLLVLHRASGEMTHAHVAELGRFLRPGDVLVTNNTRVFAARLLGVRVPSGGAVECLLLAPPVETAEADPRSAECEALVHPGQKLRPGARVRFAGAAGSLLGEVLEQRFFGRRRMRLTVEQTAPGVGAGVNALVDALGHMPLPPYIKRQDEAADRERYQTIYAAERGSVAAPTAGLHFTPAIMADLAQRGVEHASVTLHVGYGTFKPVRVERVEEHRVDAEPYEVSARTAQVIAAARRDHRRIVAVGTTTARALEHAAMQGDGVVRPGAASADVFIHPGFRFRVVDALFTNFHVPRSSLLMLAAAFAGRERILSAYEAAIREGYRFYSYGDAMLIV